MFLVSSRINLIYSNNDPIRRLFDKDNPCVKSDMNKVGASEQMILYMR